MDRLVSSASYAASGSVGVWGLLTFNQWLALGGFALAAATFLTNLIFRYLHYRLEQRKAALLEEKA
ncbi:bacteriophage holin family HP1 [Rhodobiaceae bacterium]|nr:bacteriophage holin family HP1 [Rhodobiaceae bacterium]